MPVPGRRWRREGEPLTEAVSGHRDRCLAGVLRPADRGVGAMKQCVTLTVLRNGAHHARPAHCSQRHWSRQEAEGGGNVDKSLGVVSGEGMGEARWAGLGLVV